MRREKNANEPNAAKVGKVRFLHATDLPKELLETTEPMPRGLAFQKLLATLWHVPYAIRGLPRKRWLAYREWQRTGILLFCRLARNLDNFNAAYRAPVEPARPLCELLDPSLRRTPSVSPPPAGTRSHDLLTHSSETYHALVPLVAARRFAADESGKLRIISERTLRTMIVLVFAFALCVHLLAHWEPPEKDRDRGGPTDKPSYASGFDTRENNGSGVLGEPSFGFIEGFTLRTGFGLTGLLAGFASLILFWWHRQKQVEERDQDYRALSEGLRVQIFWCLAGLPRAVAAHYMARQRNDLEWIRGAIASLAMPHHRWSRWFDDVSQPPAAPRTALKRNRLCWVQQLWVEDQARYYERRAGELMHALHFFHKVGAVLALSGVLQTCAAVGEVWKGWLDGTPAQEFFATVLLAGTKTTLLLLLGWLIVWMGRATRIIKEKKSWREAFSATARSSFQAFFDMLIPTGHGQGRTLPQGEGWGMFLAFLLHLPLAFGVATMTTAICALLCEAHPASFPSTLNLSIITSGVLLVAGALAIAWTEKNLFSEQAYRYNAMASLFGAAKSRVHDALYDLDAETDPAKWGPHLERIQQMFYDLGVEALDENAEWLILHRARPMEPVMAG